MFNLGTNTQCEHRKQIGWTETNSNS